MNALGNAIMTDITDRRDAPMNCQEISSLARLGSMSMSLSRSLSTPMSSDVASPLKKKNNHHNHTHNPNSNHISYSSRHVAVADELNRTISSPSSISTVAGVSTIDNDSNTAATMNLTLKNESLKAKQQKVHKILILDWDNTILPSDYLKELGYKIDDDISIPLPKELLVLELQIYELLKVAIHELSCDNVVIVTNAEKGWVELSALHFLPRCVHILKYLHILSARSMFEKKYPQAFQWKHRCMHFIMQKCWKINLPYIDNETLKDIMKIHMDSYLLNIQTLYKNGKHGMGDSQHNILKNLENEQSSSKNRPLSNNSGDFFSSKTETRPKQVSNVPRLSLFGLFSQHLKQSLAEEKRIEKDIHKFERDNDANHYHIISIGDSWAERNACLAFNDQLSHVFVKSIKLKEKPSITQVIHQLQQLTQVLPQIIAHPSNLDYFMP